MENDSFGEICRLRRGCRRNRANGPRIHTGTHHGCWRVKNVRRRARHERVVHGRLRRHVDGGCLNGQNCTLRETLARVHAVNRCRVKSGLPRCRYAGRSGSDAVFTVTGHGVRENSKKIALRQTCKWRERIVRTFFSRCRRQADGLVLRQGTIAAGTHGNTGAPDGRRAEPAG